MRLPHDEAVRYIKNLFTKQARREAIEFWRKEYGDGYAEKIEADVRAQWKKKQAG